MLGRRSRNTINFVSFTAPALTLIILFLGVPLATSVLYAFTTWDGIGSGVEYVGLANFVRIFSAREAVFWQSVVFTLKYTLANMVLVNAVGLGLALLLTSSVPLKSFFRASFFSPFVLSIIVVAFIWRFIFIKGSAAAFDLTGIGIFQTSWLSDPDVVFSSFVIVSMWQSVGFFMVIYIAGLESIPPELYEAGKIDGAGPIAEFRLITMPMLGPAVTTTIFFSLIGSLKVFDIVFALTRGGPGSLTYSVAYDIFQTGFIERRFGLGTAKGLLLFLFILLATLFQLRFARRRVVEL